MNYSASKTFESVKILRRKRLGNNYKLMQYVVSSLASKQFSFSIFRENATVDFTEVTKVKRWKILYKKINKVANKTC